MKIARLTTIALVSSLGFAGGVSVAQAQQSCEWYAKTALQQQQENEHKKCGFTGPSWSSDLRAHQAWCASQPPEAWKAEAQKRAQQLQACPKK